MKTKTLFIILSFTYSFISYAQKTLDTEIILTSNDTLRTKIRVYATVIDNGFFNNELNFYKSVRILDGDGNKHKIDADFIKQMKFVDLNGKKRTFVQNSGKLAELKYNGKITWLRESYQYNYSKINTDYLKNELGEEVKMGEFNSYRNKLKQITKSKPELKSLIEETTMNDAGILLILEKYEGN
ncbi:hypothetical protein ABID42_003496 [Arcicella rosea]|uniref:hypothetical protein n=1 Tax=Arcicella rosea TaxID=502909 RepID=UPI00345D4C10